MKNEVFAKIYVSGLDNPFLITEETLIDGCSYNESSFPARIDEILSNKDILFFKLGYPSESNVYLVFKSHVSVICREHYFYE